VALLVDVCPGQLRNKFHCEDVNYIGYGYISILAFGRRTVRSA
jgi:hypothetical protein